MLNKIKAYASFFSSGFDTIHLGTIAAVLHRLQKTEELGLKMIERKGRFDLFTDVVNYYAIILLG